MGRVGSISGCDRIPHLDLTDLGYRLADCIFCDRQDRRHPAADLSLLKEKEMNLATNYTNVTNLFILCGLGDLCVQTFSGISKRRVRGERRDFYSYHSCNSWQNSSTNIYEI
jgi:hypothetical protein